MAEKSKMTHDIIETKAEVSGARSPEIATAMHDFLNAFEEFKHANDTRLEELLGSDLHDGEEQDQ